MCRRCRASPSFVEPCVQSVGAAVPPWVGIDVVTPVILWLFYPNPLLCVRRTYAANEVLPSCMWSAETAALLGLGVEQLSSNPLPCVCRTSAANETTL